jgi:D-Tyr-tRNAtyr deacylase
MNSIRAGGWAILLVSQFILAALDRVVVLVRARSPAESRALIELLAELRERSHGRLRPICALMAVELINDGPVTLVVELPPGV